MSSQLNVGEAWLLKRNIQRWIFISVLGLAGGVAGLNYVIQSSQNPQMTPEVYLQNLPIGWVLLFSVFMILALIYNWIRFDEFEKEQYDKSSSFGLFASVLIIPWYFASLKGILPAPHPLACFFLIFGSKWLFHNLFKYR